MGLFVSLLATPVFAAIAVVHVVVRYAGAACHRDGTRIVVVEPVSSSSNPYRHRQTRIAVVEPESPWIEPLILTWLQWWGWGFLLWRWALLVLMWFVALALGRRAVS